MEIRHLTVIGAGTMGNGIAQVFAQHGFSVTMHDLTQGLLERGLKAVHSSLDRQIKKSTLTEAQKKETLSRLAISDDLNQSVQSADMVIEAATEDRGIKKELFKTIDASSPPQAVL